jgi:hypothetical protein
VSAHASSLGADGLHRHPEDQGADALVAEREADVASLSLARTTATSSRARTVEPGGELGGGWAGDVELLVVVAQQPANGTGVGGFGESHGDIGHAPIMPLSTACHGYVDCPSDGVLSVFDLICRRRMVYSRR